MYAETRLDCIVQGHDAEKVLCMQKQENRLLTIKFNADTAAQMRWNFRPQQSGRELFFN